MKAEYTVKIGNVFYKAGEEIPDIAVEKKEEKAVEAMKVAEPPISKPEVEEKPAEKDAKPSKRQYSRKK